jgi:hypothetical protein
MNNYVEKGICPVCGRVVDYEGHPLGAVLIEPHFPKPHIYTSCPAMWLTKEEAIKKISPRYEFKRATI